MDRDFEDDLYAEEPLGFCDDEYSSKNETNIRNEGVKIGRNEKCPCGSGKKYKKCCGRTLKSDSSMALLNEIATAY